MPIRPQHRRRRWLTLHQRKASGDLFPGSYKLYAKAVPDRAGAKGRQTG